MTKLVCMNAQSVAINPISRTHPTVASQWHPTKNGDLLPDMVTYGSAKKVWWLGPCGHEWKTMVANRTKGSGCPYCARGRGRAFKNLDATHPELAAQWHPTKNGKLKASDVSYGTKRKVWWKGQCGHDWRACVSNRARHTSNVCPKCAVPRKRKSLGEECPSLAEQWHPDNNGGLSPFEVSRGSGKKVWWIGKCGHEWCAAINNRVAGSGCPVCSGHKVLAGFNDLATTEPETATWWHPTKNENLRPSDVTRGSSRKVWWRCPEGHEWRREVAGVHDMGCSKCGITPGGSERCNSVPHDRGRAGAIPMPKFLISQWHPSKNGKLLPRHVSGGSGRKVWWQCSRGHSWRASVASRSNGTGCPVCNSGASESEKEVRETVKTLTKNRVLHNVRGGFLGGLELDVYVPDVALGIEFNGEYWHDETVFTHVAVSHNRKKEACDEAGVRLVVVWENDWKNNRDDVVSQLRHVLSGGDIPKSMTYESRRVGKVMARGSTQQPSTRGAKRPQNRPRGRSVVEYNPDVARQWHPEKNGDLTPRDVTYGTNRKAWWVCAEGHEWRASIRTRTVRGHGCPHCRRRPGKPLIDDDRFEMWDHDKNHGTNPGTLTTGSCKEAWWKCPGGHEWREKIAYVTRRRNACPECKKTRPNRNLVVSNPKNPLSKTHPNVAIQWHTRKNGGLNPSNVTAGSKRRVWWMCSKCGREWQAEIRQRVKSPHCARCTPIRGVTKGDPISRHLVEQWHPTKNEWLRPDMVTAGSGKRVWWICGCGNVWATTVANRTNGSGCPKCARRNRRK